MTSSVELELRSLVRDLIKESLPEIDMTPEVRTVRLTTDADLAAFVSTLLALAEEPSTRDRLRTGQLRFSLAPGRDGEDRSQEPTPLALVTPAANGTSSSVLQVDRGAVTERMLLKAISDGRRVVLGKAAVLTPLAREQARRHNIDVERRS